jgi:hypothetical protein
MFNIALVWPVAFVYVATAKVCRLALRPRFFTLIVSAGLGATARHDAIVRAPTEISCVRSGWKRSITAANLRSK